MKTIAIIGAGLSGTLLTMNLLKQNCNESVHVKWIDRNSEKDMGPAYSTNENYLLNVPVELMGAFSKDPEHFLKWSLSKKVKVQKGDYLPRKFYREYIQTMLKEAIDEKQKNITLKRIRDEVVDININKNKAKIFFNKTPDAIADKVVLALGNSLPKNPELKNKDFVKDKRYIQNPWNPELLKLISDNDTIFFIGTGQTMVDLATGLYGKKHKGKMIGISRRAFLPMSQKKVEPYPSFYDELKNETSILSVLKIVRKHINAAMEKELDPRAVIDSLRPYTMDIWKNFPSEEKAKFLRHVFRYWEIIRSRIPPESEKIINELKSTGQLKILKGRIKDITSEEDVMKIKYTERDPNNVKIEAANFIINCKGPNLDYEKIEQKLIKNLINKKIIQRDPVHIGINALPDGSIIDKNGNPSTMFYTLGPTLKGIVWESLATPEIRVQAENLSKSLILN